MKVKALLLTLVFTVSPIANAVEYGKLADSVDAGKASESVDTETLKSSVGSDGVDYKKAATSSSFK